MPRISIPAGWAPNRYERAIFVLVIVLFVFFSATSRSTFDTVDNGENILRQLSFAALIGLGEMVVMIGGGIDISVGLAMSMTAALVMGTQHYGVVPSILIGVAFCSAVGVVNGLLVAKVQIVPFIATLGTMTILTGMVHVYSHDQPIPGQNPDFTVLGNGSVGPIPVPFLVLVAAAVLVHVFLTYTPTGRAIYAVGGDPEASRIVGINVEMTRIVSFVICGFLTGLAAVLLSSELNSSSTQLGSSTALFTLTGVIMGGASLLGGRGSARGAVLGMLALTMLATGLNGLSMQTAQQTIIQAVVFVTVVVVDAVVVTSSSRQRSLRSSVTRLFGGPRTGEA